MTVVGVDLSTLRVNTAWMSGTGPKRWHCDLGKGHIIDRVRRVHMVWPATVTEIAIEYPFGRSRLGAGSLMAVVGAITKSTPSYARVAWPSSGDLRAALGARNTKDDAVRALHEHVNPRDLPGWDEHELDALVTCLGWTLILNSQDAA